MTARGGYIVTVEGGRDYCLINKGPMDWLAMERDLRAALAQLVGIEVNSGSEPVIADYKATVEAISAIIGHYTGRGYPLEG